MLKYILDFLRHLDLGPFNPLYPEAGEFLSEYPVMWIFVVAIWILLPILFGCVYIFLFKELLPQIRRERTCPKTWHKWHVYTDYKKEPDPKYPGLVLVRKCKRCGHDDRTRPYEYPGYNSAWVKAVVFGS
jgi:hypothetical protein